MVANVKEPRRRRAASAGIPVIHVWYIVEKGAPGLKLNAPLFQGVKDGERARPRHVGRGARRGPRAEATATSSSRRCG